MIANLGKIVSSVSAPLQTIKKPLIGEAIQIGDRLSM
jgi:hypothetical protein